MQLLVETQAIKCSAPQASSYFISSDVNAAGLLCAATPNQLGAA